MNNVIAGLVQELRTLYGVISITGFRNGYRGFIAKYGHDTVDLSHIDVQPIRSMGGSILGTSRGNQDPIEIVDALEQLGIGALFVIGGDGTMRGAMTIVEVVDAHDGFEVITERVKTQSLNQLLWMVGILTFFLSSVLDNLTTAIVMVSLMKKLLGRRDDRLFFAGIIVIAANAGGAWTPIGDVTTTMLWIGGQITPANIIKTLFAPSVVNLLVPLLIVSWQLRGQSVDSPALNEMDASKADTTAFERNLMFFMGLGVLVAVPAFKTLTHLPPFMEIGRAHV